MLPALADKKHKKRMIIMSQKLEINLRVPDNSISRRNKAGKIEWASALKDFADDLKWIQKNMLRRKVTSRGWAYLLETKWKAITKDQFDYVQDLINKCRKNGMLPIDFVEADKNRSFHNIEVIEYEEPNDYLISGLEWVKDRYKSKEDFDFWESQEYYIQMMVEKIDILNMFKPVCEKYHICIANGKGWSDLSSRADLSSRYKYYEERGKKCVLLYVKDKDPGGDLIADKLKKNIDDIKLGTGWDPKDLIIDTFLLTYDFIQKHNLPWIDNLTSGSGKPPDKKRKHIRDYIAAYGERKVEANILVVMEDTAVQELEDTIEKYLGNDPFTVYQTAVDEDQEKVKEVMDSVDFIQDINDMIDKLKVLRDEE